MALLCETVTGRSMAELLAARDRATAGDLVELRLDGVVDLDVAAALHGRSRPAVALSRAVSKSVIERPVTVSQSSDGFIVTARLKADTTSYAHKQKRLSNRLAEEALGLAEVLCACLRRWQLPPQSQSRTTTNSWRRRVGRRS